mmetsp:Transcript_14972/g.41692  ORF Transcript_14972/g.41692 Transcript_14972/m.41692 type:complete len:163 (-) Transcript_14972:2682-3170(-)
MRRQKCWVAITSNMPLLKQTRNSHLDVEDQKTTCSCSTIKASNLTHNSDDSTECNHNSNAAILTERRAKQSGTILRNLRLSIVSISRNHRISRNSVCKQRISQNARDLLEEAEKTTKGATTTTTVAAAERIRTRIEPKLRFSKSSLSPAAASVIADSTVFGF